jgi:outer membrane protein TolC
LLLVYSLMIIVAIFCIFDLYALDDSLKKLLRQATGITEDDVKSAAEKREISLFDAYALAVQKTERMAIEGENSIQAQERKLQAIESFLPYFSIRANLALPLPDKNYVSLARSAVSLYLRQPIFTGLKEVSRMQSAWSEGRIKEYQLNLGAYELLMEVGVAYYSVLLAERDLKNNEELLDLHNKTLAELQRRVGIGRSRQSEILRTGAQINALQARIKSLRTSRDHARLVLSTLIGIEPVYTLADSPGPGDPSFTVEDTQRLIESRWDVKAAKEQIVSARAGVISAYGTHLPSVYLEGSYVIDQGKQYKVDRAKQGLQMALSTNPLSAIASGYLNNGVPPKTRDYYFSFGAELPIFGGDITFAKVREANSVKRQADLIYTQMLRVARQDIADSFQVWESSKIELEAYRKALTYAEENNRVVAGEYRLNLVTILDVLTALTSLQSARYDYERALLQLKLNRIRLGIATNEFSGEKIRALKQ